MSAPTLPPHRRLAESPSEIPNEDPFAEPFIEKAADSPVLPNGESPPGQAAIDADAEVARLAELEPIERDREIKAVAKALGCRIATLYAAVKASLGEAGATGQGRPLELPEIEPWPEPVNGATLLDDIVAAGKRYVVMDPGSAECVALWTLHAHALDAFGISPRLAITSPRPGCGKTTLLDVLSHLVPRPLVASNVSSAAVYRTVEVAQPVLLMDEADTFLVKKVGSAGGGDELRGVLDAGHRRGSSVIRIVGDNLEPRQFSTWCACAIAMIGKLPGTLADRSIPIALKRKRPDEAVERFRFDRTAELDELARKAARWARDHLARLRGMDPLLPPSLGNRQADNWRILIAIADAAGGDWPRRAREIAVATVDADQAKRTGLLADIRDIFAAKGCDQISSADLVAALVGIEGGQWAEYRDGRPLTQNTLARLLAVDGIKPDGIRVGLKTPNGYRLEQFSDAFERYLPPTPQNQTSTPPQMAENLGSPGFFEPPQPNPCGGLESAENPSNSAGCGGVEVGKGGNGEDDAHEPPKTDLKSALGEDAPDEVEPWDSDIAAGREAII